MTARLVILTLTLALTGTTAAWLHTVRSAATERKDWATRETEQTEHSDTARQLHDIVIHRVTAILIQAEAAVYHTTPHHLDQTLSAITDTSRKTITDLRQLHTLLNAGRSAAPPSPRSPTTGSP